MGKKGRVSGLQATHAALEESKRGPISLEPADCQTVRPTLPASPENAKGLPRVRKPHPNNDQYVAPPGVGLEDLRARLREAFGNTLSDEFVQVMMRKLIDALAPSPHDNLDETTLNAGLAIVSSMQPQSELEALLAVQIVATGFSGLRFLRDSHRQMTNDFIDVYGGYAERLLKLQAEFLRVFDRHRRGNRQTVVVRHVHLHPGSQGMIGIVNNQRREGDHEK
jgi:hypothetical protein